MLESAAQKIDFTPATAASPCPPAPVIVIGAGPVGMKFARELHHRRPDQPIVIFGEERWPPYNRVLLTPLFAGETRIRDIYAPWKPGPDTPNVRLRCGRIAAIDRIGHTVTDAAGGTYAYGKVVLATGSRPHVPTPFAISHPDIFTFRNIDDAERLLAHWPRCCKAVVVGGGLLGLEAARGLHRRGVDTTVIEHEAWLMAQQIDRTAGALLADRLTAIGLGVLTGVGVKEVIVDGRIAGVRLTDGREIACDTVVICAGIRPNMEIARDAGIAVGRGIRVNDNMQTSDPDIYAVGECAEHRERVYGLVAPGLEQAGVAAHHLAGGTADYRGSIAATKLKVVGVPVFSMGPLAAATDDTSAHSITHQDREDGTYRRLIVARGRLKAAVAVGDWSEINRLQEAVSRGRRVLPWQAWRFARSGELWRAESPGGIGAWPETATVCNCTGVTRGALSAAIGGGAMTIEALQAATNASTVCGSCRPLLAELVGQPAVAKAPAFARSLVVLSGFALIAMLVILFATPPAYRESVQDAFPIDLLWTESLYKQISGFTLLGLGLLAILLSLRKRWRWLSFGEYGTWRLIHVALGLTVVAVLIVHTGLHLGVNLNRFLMINVAALSLLGAASGGITALEHRMGRAAGIQARRLSLWLHILACWPLPALLGFHVLAVYYF